MNTQQVHVGTILHHRYGATFTRETLRDTNDAGKLLKKALQRKESQLVIAQIIAEKLGRRARADWALAMALQAARMIDDPEVTYLASCSAHVYGGLYGPKAPGEFHAKRIAAVRRLMPKNNCPRTRKLVGALNYFLARVENVIEGRDLLDEFEPACLTYLLAGFQFRRDSVFPVDKMLHRGIKLLRATP